MIKIYKNKNNQLECHMMLGGYDFKFQAVKDTSWSVTYFGSDSNEYLEFERNVDENNEILSNVQDVMSEMLFSDEIDWETLFEDTKETTENEQKKECNNMNELFVVLVEFQGETSVGGIFESEELAREYISELSTKELEDNPLRDYVEVSDSLYVLIQKTVLNEHIAIF